MQHTDMQPEPGHPLPLGAFITDRGVQFNLFSRHAEEVSLLLFDEPDAISPAAIRRFDPDQNRTGDVWHMHIPGLKPGQLYLYQLSGPREPDNGHRFDYSAWLLDPYAKALTHDRPWKEWKQELMPKCIVVDDNFDWEGDKPLNYPLQECIIYETHLAGLTRHPSAGASRPGTYREVIGLIPYFTRLGITSLEFLPVQEFNPNEIIRDNPRSGERLTNYWGYSTVGFFAPACQYAASRKHGGQVTEFKEMVKQLHAAGIEVILDIVFNHTAEGNEEGPTFSFRGIDNSIYYILDESRRKYLNFSGCGNTMNCNHPIVRSFILDCLHYWVMEMHVDGFRFDLGSILGRDSTGRLLENPPIIERIAEDPILRDTKLIAEAWDASGTYQVGSFHTTRWAEWNDRFRDDIRQFWAGRPGMTSGLAMRFAGSADLYLSHGRKPYHSINYITAHDGFTLNDLVSYGQKHNEENGEDNKDGHNTNFSRNFGTEGPEAPPETELTRSRMVKNFLATLLLSAGTPMLLGGDEFRRTQQGNNNAYCQDNEISWFNWHLAEQYADILQFTRSLIAFRQKHPLLNRAEFFSGQDNNKNGVPDIAWLDENNHPKDWSSQRNILAIRIDGSMAEIFANEDDDDFFLMFNGEEQPVNFVPSPPPEGTAWCRKLDTSRAPAIIDDDWLKPLKNQRMYKTGPQSMVVLVSQKVLTKPDSIL